MIPWGRRLPPALALLASGCVLDYEVADPENLRCTRDEDCPAATVCLETIERCVDPARLKEKPIDIVSATLDAARMSRVSPFDTNALRVELTRAPVSFGATVAGAPIDCDSDGINVICAFTTPADAIEGDAVVVFEGADDLGNIAREARGFTFDFTGPRVDSFALAYEAAPSNPRLGDVLTSAAIGTFVVGSFVFDREAHDVTATAAGFDFVDEDGPDDPGLFFVRTLFVTSAAPTGLHTITVAATDEVGNPGTDDLVNALDIDADPPAALDVNAPGLVTYVRAPWGDAFPEQTGAEEPIFEVRVQASAIAETESLLRIFADDLLIGSTNAADVLTNPPPEFVKVKFATAADRPVVAIEVVDRAGNVSTREEVRHVEWRANLRNKVPGSTVENPNRVSTTHRLTAPLAPEVVEVTDLTRMKASALHRWVPVNDASAPAPGGSVVFAHDLARGRVLAFHDSGGVFALRDGQWDLEPVTNLQQAVAPTGTACVAYDERRDVVVIIGAERNDGLIFTGVLELSGDRLAVRALEGGPGPLTSAACAYDAARGGVVVIGGNVQGIEGIFNTRAWLLTSEWNDLGDEISDVIGARVGASAAGLAGVGVVVFGGVDDNDTLLGDTLLLDETGVAAVTGGASPSARTGSSFAVDHAAGLAWLYGGTSAGNTAEDDLWRMDGTTWTQVSASLAGPAEARIAIADGALWKATSFGTLWRAALVDDGVGALIEVTARGFAPDHGIVDVVTDADGALYAVGYDELAQTATTHRFLNNAWSEPGGTEPPYSNAAHGDAGARLGDDGVLLAFDEASGDARLYDVNGAGVWSVRGPALPGFVPVGAFTLDDEVWALGDLGAVRFSGAAWDAPVSTGGVVPIEACIASTPTRAIVVDSQDDGFGGFVAVTYAFDGVWSELTDAGLPASSAFTGCAYDAARDAVLLFGGISDGVQQNETWELVADEWRFLPVASPPLPRDHANLVAVPGVGTMMFGGFASAPLADVWRFDDGDAMPAVIFDAAFAAASSEDVTIDLFTVTVTGGGVGPNGSVLGVPGVRLALWSGDHFETLAENSADPSEPLTFMAVTNVPELLARVRVGARGSVFAAVTPLAAGNHAGANAAVSITNVQTSVHYTRPAPGPGAP